MAATNNNEKGETMTNTYKEELCRILKIKEMQFKKMGDKPSNKRTFLFLEIDSLKQEIGQL